MKTLVALVATIVTVSGYLIHVPTAPIIEPALAPGGWVHMQHKVLPLFENVCEESDNPTIVRLAQEFMTTTSATEFWDADCFTKLKQLKSTNGLLAKGEIFSEYNSDHVAELKIVFDVLKNAKTFDTFYEAAAWVRQNLNCGLYVDAIYLALVDRSDTDKVNLPAPYELLPNYFIRKDIIIQGSSLLAGQEISPSSGVRDEGNTYTLDANYTADIHDNDDDSKLAYFREDVGLNSYYFLSMLKNAPWKNVNVNINSRYGEEMYHWIKQWMSRYNLERYSNGMAEIDGLNWDLVADIPYDPMLVYSNGNEFIHRNSQVNIEENDDKALLKTIEANLGTVVSHMRDSGYNKTQIFNHLMEILITGERSYDTLGRRLLGKALSNNGNPSVLEHYLTSLRDPIFWKLNKKIVDLIDNALKVLPPYAKSELYFPGVEVVNVEVKKMTTSFEHFQFDITDALKIGNGDSTFHVKIGQPRLTHKPFTIKINIASLVAQKGMVKIFLGPKIMPGEFSKKKNLFGLLDCFDINIKKGSNVITRSSEDITRYSPDFVSLQTLRSKVEDAQFGLDSLPLNSMNSQIQFPSRMILPKGTAEGLPLQLLVFVAPYMKTTPSSVYSVTNMEFNDAIMSKLYPLDLPIDDNMLLGLPNLMFKDTTITFKSTNSAASSTSNSYVRPSQPNAWGSGQFSQDDTIMPVGTYDVYPLQKDLVQAAKQIPKYATKNNGFISKQSYEKSDYSSYKKYDYKNFKKDVTMKPTDIPAVEPIAEPTEMPKVIEIINKPIIDNDGAGMQFVSSEMQNDSPAESMTQTTKYDYSKNKFDYKSKRPSYKKFDYKTFKNKPLDEVPLLPQDNITTTRKHVDIEIVRIPDVLVWNKDSTNTKYDETHVNDNEKEEATDFDSMDTINILEVNDDNNELKVVPLMKLTMPKQKAFLIYDYIIHSLWDDRKVKTDSEEEQEEEKTKEEKKESLS